MVKFWVKVKHKSGEYIEVPVLDTCNQVIPIPARATLTGQQEINLLQFSNFLVPMPEKVNGKKEYILSDSEYLTDAPLVWIKAEECLFVEF